MTSTPKAISLSLLLLLLPVARSFPASYGTGHEMHFDESEKSVDKRLDLMNKKLDLSPDQQFRVKAALDEQITKMDLLKKEYLEAKKKIADDTDGTMMGILTPQQQEKYKKIKPDILGKTDIPPVPVGDNHTER